MLWCRWPPACRRRSTTRCTRTSRAPRRRRRWSASWCRSGEGGLRLGHEVDQQHDALERRLVPGLVRHPVVEDEGFPLAPRARLAGDAQARIAIRHGQAEVAAQVLALVALVR